MTHRYPRILPCGDSAILVEFGDRIDVELNERVVALERVVQEFGFTGLVECVPAYRSLLVHVDPLIVDHEEMMAALARLARDLQPQEGASRRWRVPVVYGGEHGVDLEPLATRHGISPAVATDLHASTVYRVHLVGFMPGFTYLGGLDPRLATPRRTVPRRRIPSGSVAIGGSQSAIGSIPSPSGWHLIGRTPVRCFDPGRDPMFLFEVGDEVEFKPVAAADWEKLADRSAAGETVAERYT